MAGNKTLYELLSLTYEYLRGRLNEADDQDYHLRRAHFESLVLKIDQFAKVPNYQLANNDLKDIGKIVQDGINRFHRTILTTWCGASQRYADHLRDIQPKITLNSVQDCFTDLLSSEKKQNPLNQFIEMRHRKDDLATELQSISNYVHCRGLVKDGDYWVRHDHFMDLMRLILKSNGSPKSIAEIKELIQKGIHDTVQPFWKLIGKQRYANRLQKLLDLRLIEKGHIQVFRSTQTHEQRPQLKEVIRLIEDEFTREKTLSQDDGVRVF